MTQSRPKPWKREEVDNQAMIESRALFQTGMIVG
jgi:hypothetical protein